jgi:hypothetical protein
MTRRAVLMATVAILAIALRASAHDEIRIIGTVVEAEATHLVLKTSTGNTVTLGVGKGTVVFRQGPNRDDQKVTMAEVEAGLYVVVDAFGDSEEDASAEVIRIVPPPSTR